MLMQLECQNKDKGTTLLYQIANNTVKIMADNIIYYCKLAVISHQYCDSDKSEYIRILHCIFSHSNIII